MRMAKRITIKLYDNVNLKGGSSRDLSSFKYHDKLYLIWNFIKHNNLDTYENLKRGRTITRKIPLNEVFSIVPMNGRLKKGELETEEETAVEEEKVSFFQKIKNKILLT